MKDEQLKNIYKILGAIFFIIWVIAIIWGFKIGQKNKILPPDNSYREKIIKAQSQKEKGLILADKIAIIREFENLEPVFYQNKTINKQAVITNYSPVTSKPVIPSVGPSAIETNKEYYKGLK